MTEASKEQSEVFFATSTTAKAAPQTFGRYVLHHPIARGGMARVYTARLIGAEGFNRLVAAKRLHPQFTDDPEFVTMFHDEARIASKIHHPNVVPVLDVVVEGQEVILVQEYVHGVPLDTLFKAVLVKETPIPAPIVVAIVAGVLSGLHAAHETTDEMDQPLNIVHRDVSPQNVMVSVDGIPRLLDFGIARARSSAHVTREGFFKGKVAYMAPEQLRAENVTRTADVYAVGVLLWELLAHRRLHTNMSETQIFSAVLSGALPTLTAALEDERASIDDERWLRIASLEPIVERALATLPENRYGNAAAMLDVLLDTCPAATSMEVAHWVKSVGAAYLDRRQKVLASSEESWRTHSKVTSSTMPVARDVSGRDVSMMKPTTRSDGPDPTQSEAPDPWMPPPSAWPLGGGPEAAPSRAASMRVRLPWVAAAALLVTSATLVVVLASGGDAAPAELARPLDIHASLPAPAAVAPPEPAPSTLTLAVARPPSPPPAAPPARAAAAAKPAPAPTRDAPATAASPPPAAPAKLDCDPPFYFDGAKKLYKPGCL